MAKCMDTQNRFWHMRFHVKRNMISNLKSVWIEVIKQMTFVYNSGLQNRWRRCVCVACTRVHQKREQVRRHRPSGHFEIKTWSGYHWAWWTFFSTKAHQRFPTQCAREAPIPRCEGGWFCWLMKLEWCVRGMDVGVVLECWWRVAVVLMFGDRLGLWIFIKTIGAKSGKRSVHERSIPCPMDRQVIQTNRRPYL